MSVETTRPNQVFDNGTVEVVPPTISVAAALADNESDTYVICSAGNHPDLGFVEPTGIPAGAMVKSARLRAQARIHVGPNPDVLVNWNFSDTNNNMTGHRSGWRVPSATWTTREVATDSNTGTHVTPTNLRVDWFAYGQGARSPMELAALYFDTIYVEKPEVTVTAPTGTVTGDTTPTIRWANTLDGDADDSGAAKFFEVKLFSSGQAGYAAPAANTPAQAGHHSLVTSSGLTEWTPADLLLDGTWRAWVRVSQTVNGVVLWSDWANTQFTLAIARPGVPSLSLTSESLSARIRVGLSSNAGAATTNLFQTQVSDDGTNWAYLRTDLGNGESALSGAAATEYDYEGANGAIRFFRARSLHIYPEGFAASAWTTAQQSSWTSPDWWVKSLLNPALNVMVLPRSQPSATRTGSVGLFKPLDAKYPIAVLDKRSSAAGQIVFRFDTDAARDAFEALADSTSVVLIQAPAGVIDWPDRYCALGDYERERALDSSTNAYTFDSVQWTEVERPAP